MSVAVGTVNLLLLALIHATILWEANIKFTRVRDNTRNQHGSFGTFSVNSLAECAATCSRMTPRCIGFLWQKNLQAGLHTCKVLDCPHDSNFVADENFAIYIRDDYVCYADRHCSGPYGPICRCNECKLICAMEFQETSEDKNCTGTFFFPRLQKQAKRSPLLWFEVKDNLLNLKFDPMCSNVTLDCGLILSPIEPPNTMYNFWPESENTWPPEQIHFHHNESGIIHMSVLEKDPTTGLLISRSDTSFHVSSYTEDSTEIYPYTFDIIVGECVNQAMSFEIFLHRSDGQRQSLLQTDLSLLSCADTDYFIAPTHEFVSSKNPKALKYTVQSDMKEVVKWHSKDMNCPGDHWYVYMFEKYHSCMKVEPTELTIEDSSIFLQSISRPVPGDTNSAYSVRDELKFNAKMNFSNNLNSSYQVILNQNQFVRPRMVTVDETVFDGKETYGLRVSRSANANFSEIKLFRYDPCSFGGWPYDVDDCIEGEKTIIAAKIFLDSADASAAVVTCTENMTCDYLGCRKVVECCDVIGACQMNTNLSCDCPCAYELRPDGNICNCTDCEVYDATIHAEPIPCDCNETASWSLEVSPYQPPSVHSTLDPFDGAYHELSIKFVQEAPVCSGRTCLNSTGDCRNEYSTGWELYFDGVLLGEATENLRDNCLNLTAVSPATQEFDLIGFAGVGATFQHDGWAIERLLNY